MPKPPKPPPLLLSRCLVCGEPSPLCDGPVCINCRSKCPLQLPPWNRNA